MKIIFLLFFISSLLFSNVYYSKIEPYEIRDISSNVSGLVVFSAENMLGKRLSSTSYIEVDSSLNIKELKFTKEKLVSLNTILNSNSVILENTEKLLEKKRKNYERIASLKIKSDVEKNREFYDLILSENQYLSTKKEIDNYKINILDLKFKIAFLEKKIADKNLKAKDFVLYELLVKEGQVVNISTPLAKVADISKAKLIIFLDSEDMLEYKSKSIYIDGVKTDYKIDRIINIADSKNISKYKAEIIIKSPKVFSKLVKIELRDE